MGQFLHPSSKRSPTSLRPVRIKTTLYDVIDAVGNAVKGEEEKLISEIVLHLVNSGKIKLAGGKTNVVTG